MKHIKKFILRSLNECAERNIYNMAKKTGTIKEVWKYVSRYRIYIIFSLFLAAVTVALNLYIPILAGQAIDKIAGRGNVDFSGLIKILTMIAAAAVMTSVSQWVMNTLNNKITFNVVRDLREDAFAKIERLSFSYIDLRHSGEIVSRVISDAEQLADGLLMGFTQLFTGVMTIAGTLFIMFKINVLTALVVFVLTPLSLLVAKYIASKTYSMFKLQSETRGEQTAFIDEHLNHIEVSKAFSAEEKLCEEFDEINDRLYDCSLKAVFFSSITNPATRFVNNIVYAAVALCGAVSVCNGLMSVGQLSSFLSYANQYTKPFNEISGVITELQNAIACARRLLDLINEPSISVDKPGVYELENPEGNIEIKNVSFSYSPDKPLIENLSLDVIRGKKVAIVGKTGCGKTTFINLLMRFYEITGGEISVDGKSVDDISLRSLRQAYGMVLQETWLKTGTVRENIMMGKTDATEEEIINAAKASNAYGFIRRLPQGLDTVIGEDGGNLSQGQKQLLCICRVMLRLPPMLILDEATSSIDTRTEIKIQKAFSALMQGRTSFIVAHRLSTIRESDIILVMDKGKIVEQGSHSELIENGGYYKKLYNSQFETV